MFSYILNEFFNSFKESPYSVNVVDTTQSLFPSDALRMASLTKGIEFTVENKNNTVQECEVYAMSKSIVFHDFLVILLTFPVLFKLLLAKRSERLLKK